jgi:hypothetical protein
VSGAAFDRDALLAAFDRIGRRAAEQGVMLEVALYGGSALMVASNFRFATEDADIAEIARPWPEWLAREVAAIASDNGWSADWLNEAVQFHLSPLADDIADHEEFGSFPRAAPPGLRVTVPSLPYMLALKLKAMRINDAARGAQEARDIRNLLRAADVRSIDEAIGVLGRFFPRSAADADRQRFFLRHIWPEPAQEDDPPSYPLRSR